MPEQERRRVRLALASVWLVPLLWSVNYLVARSAPGVVGPYMLALGRWSLAAMVLLVFSGGELMRHRGEVLGAWRQYLTLGALGMLICGAWVYEGARSTTTMNIALIYAASPVLIAMGAARWLGERFSGRQGTGVVLALAGVVHVVVKGRWTALGEVEFVAGDAWMVAATLAWAAYSLLQKKWPTSLSATARLTAICLGGVLALLPFAAWEASQPGLMQWDLRPLGLMVVAALIPGIGAYGIYGWAQRVLGASKIAISLYLGPLYAGLMAWMALGERPGLHHIVGAVLILPGVFLVTRSAPRPVVLKAAVSGSERVSPAE